jgi:acetyl-CoA C-acetyltransferase
MTVVAPRTPVLVGVGQVNRDDAGTDEPTDLLVEAAVNAAKDAGAPWLLDALDSIRVVRIFSRKYSDPAALVCQQLGLTDCETVYSEAGGDIPQVLINRTAADIAAGSCDVALVGGAEAWRSRSAAKRSGVKLDWTIQPDEQRPSQIIGTELDVLHAEDERIGLITAPHQYPFFEIALRAARGETVDEHRLRLGQLWESFGEVAAGNPYAAIREPMAASEITTPGPKNRMVGYPYTKLLNANNNVDQAAAVLLCSAEKAESLGVPRDRWVFLHGAAEGRDRRYLGERRSYTSSDPIRLAGQRAMDLAGVGIDDIGHVDLYSCFPSAVQIAAESLGISDSRLTVTGGLTFAGGPWNNYSTHAICTMVGILREDPTSYGLVTALGGTITKHAISVYSARPTTGEPRIESVQSELDRIEPVRFVAEYSGDITVETYTVMHGRDGAPELAYLACRTEDDSGPARCWGTSDDPELMSDLTTREFVGAAATLESGNVVEVS